MFKINNASTYFRKRWVFSANEMDCVKASLYINRRRQQGCVRLVQLFPNVF